MVYSQFNTKYIYTTFVLIAFGVLSSICCHLGNDSIALQSSTIQKSLIPVQEKC